MIGQERLINEFTELIEQDKLPQFIILSGHQGSGKKLLCRTLSYKLGCNYHILENNSIESIRALIETSRKVTLPTMYVIADADRLSFAAQNAMLKLVEEPPHDATFVLTVENAATILSTIRSRGRLFTMDEYTTEELDMYIDVQSSYSATEEFKSLVTLICSVPKEVNMLLWDYNISDFMDYVTKVVDNIALVSGANSFKIADKVDILGDGNSDKYDLKLFWKAFETVCAERMNDDIESYAKAILATTNARSALRMLGINKQMLFDTWILDVREAMM